MHLYVLWNSENKRRSLPYTASPFLAETAAFALRQDPSFCLFLFMKFVFKALTQYLYVFLTIQVTLTTNTAYFPQEHWLIRDNEREMCSLWGRKWTYMQVRQKRVFRGFYLCYLELNTFGYLHKCSPGQSTLLWSPVNELHVCCHCLSSAIAGGGLFLCSTFKEQLEKRMWAVWQFLVLLSTDTAVSSHHMRKSLDWFSGRMKRQSDVFPMNTGYKVIYRKFVSAKTVVIPKHFCIGQT